MRKNTARSLETGDQRIFRETEDQKTLAKENTGVTKGAKNDDLHKKEERAQETGDISSRKRDFGNDGTISVCLLPLGAPGSIELGATSTSLPGGQHPRRS